MGLRLKVFALFIKFGTCISKIPCFFFKDDLEFRNLIIWLEDQKIRHWKIEDRVGLRDTASTTWTEGLQEVHSFH